LGAGKMIPTQFLSPIERTTSKNNDNNNNK
jgi:hypothetical protein